MSSIVSTTQYVKFVRGTPTGFANLATKSSDTLYFISERDALTGDLYLGNKLISGSTSISNLGDIIISSLGDNQILVYDETQDAWVNEDINTVIGIMQGASATLNGTSGLVPVPIAGSQNKFLRGDGTWANPTIASDSDVFTVNNNSELTLVGFDQAQTGQLLQVDNNGGLQWVDPGTLQTDLTEVNQSISNLQSVVNTITSLKLQREIVDSIEDIDLTKENVIYMVPSSTTGSGDLYDEYMVINGVIELVGGNYEGDLSRYVTTTQFNTSVGNLNARLAVIEGNYVTLNKYNNEVGNLSQLLLSQDNGDTLVDQVNDLTDRLTWYLIQED